MSPGAKVTKHHLIWAKWMVDLPFELGFEYQSFQ